MAGSSGGMPRGPSRRAGRRRRGQTRAGCAFAALTIAGGLIGIVLFALLV